jgi:hypothetical protein
LVAEGAAGRPLETARTELKPGDVVYIAKASDAGQVAVVQSTVKGIRLEPQGKVVEAVVSGPHGTPLLDSQGRVVAVPPVWVAEAREPFKESRPTSSSPDMPLEKAKPAGPAPIVPRTIEDIPPERREKLEKAYRPQPDTKDDWMK